MKSDFILLLILWQRYRNIDDSLPLAETIGTYDENEDTVEQKYLIILFMLLQKQEPFIHSRYKKVFYRTLSRIERQRRDRRIPRCSLLHPDESPWRKLYNGGSNAAMITLIGLDYAAFNVLNNKFKEVYDICTPRTYEGTLRVMKKKTSTN